MAFNPFTGFQKNKRFWMAAILMICMVTFVFCTGMKGDMADRVGRLIGIGRGSTTVASYQDPNAWFFSTRNITTQELHELRIQRNFANEYIMNCSEIAYRRLNKMWFDEQAKPPAGPKEAMEREVKLMHMQAMILTIAHNKSKASQRFYDGGVKLDDLLEFKLWLAQADKMGIKLEDQHVTMLFRREFFGWPEPLLSPEEYRFAEKQALHRGNRDASEAVVRQAIAQEYRVKIAQYAVLGFQPFSWYYRERTQQGLFFKFADPDVPDEVRAPMTPAQIMDYFNKQAAQFDVALVPIKVADFAALVKDTPSEIDRSEFFKKYKDKPADPSSDEWGLERPALIKLQYLMADPDSRGYKDVAQLIGDQRMLGALSRFNPLAAEPMQSPVVTAAHYMALAQRHQIGMDVNHDAMMTNIGRRNAALLSEKDFVTPILDRLAKKHPEAIASMIAANALPSLGYPLTADVHGATAGYLAWGAIKRPRGMDVPINIKAAADKELDKDKLILGTPELEMAHLSEVRRRTPQWNQDRKAFSNTHFIDFFGWTMTPSPFDVLTPAMALDKERVYLDFHQRLHREIIEKYGLASKATIDFHLNPPPPMKPFAGGVNVSMHPPYTTETIQDEIEDILAKNIAIDWAQSDIREVRRELDRAAGHAEKYKKAMKKGLKNTKLSHGQFEDKWYSQFDVQTAPELEALRKAFNEHVVRINLYEGRDLKPETMLKSTDFWKLFFSSEKFAATGDFQPAPWPPMVEINHARGWKKPDPRLFPDIKPEEELKLKRDLLAQDFAKQAPTFDMFVTATKPVLFWRTAFTGAVRFSDYDKVHRDQKKNAQELAAIEAELKKIDDPAREEELKKKLAELKVAESDFLNLEKRILDGWKFEHARNKDALAAAKKKAKELHDSVLSAGDNEGALSTLFTYLPEPKILLGGMSLMHGSEYVNSKRDYAKYQLPKDAIEYPRDDMVDQALKLADLKEPLKIGNKELDELNKELFDMVKKDKAAGYHVQILTNKPRSIFYVAFLVKRPKANNDDLKAAFVNAAYNKAGQQRDLFLQRAQEEHARAMRTRYLENLRTAFKFDPPSDEARKNFDERGGD